MTERSDKNFLSPAAEGRPRSLDKENQHHVSSSPSSTEASASTSTTPMSPTLIPSPHHSLLAQRRGLLSTGAVRMETKHTLLLDRIGYDGTTATPSKELLKSTHASRQQQVHRETRCIPNPVAVTLEERGRSDDSSTSISPPTFRVQPPPNVTRPKPLH